MWDRFAIIVFMSKKDFRSFVCLDIEATGMDSQTDSIIEVGMVKIRDGEVVDTYESFVRPNGALDPLISIITGIHDQDLIHAPQFSHISSHIRDFAEDLPILGHNIAFDLAFLGAGGISFSQEIWDSSILSSILFPHFRSHSLEALSKKFGIEHTAHRALGDARATASLWLHLLREVSTIPFEKREQLASLLQKSTWGMKDIWRIDFNSDYQSLVSVTSREHVFTPVDVKAEGECLCLECFGVDKRDVTISLLTHLLAQKKRCLLVGGYYFLLEHIFAHFQKSDIKSSHFDQASSYIDWDVFETFLAQSSFTNNEAIFLSKVLLHFHKGKPLHKGALALLYDDHDMWLKVCCKNESASYKQVIDDISTCQLASMSQFAFFNEVLRNDTFLKSFDCVVFLDSQLLEHNITTVFGKSLSLEGAEDKLGAYLERFYQWILGKVPQSPFMQSILFHEGLKDGVFERLRAEALEFNHPVLHDFFSSDPSWIRWFRFDNQGVFSLELSPLAVNALFKKRVLQEIDHYFIADKGFFPEILGFDGETLEISSDSFCSSLQCIIPKLEEVTGTRKEGDTGVQTEYFLRNFLEARGRCAFVFSSRRVLQNFFIALQPHLLKNNIPYIVEGVTGGRGKMLEIYEESFDVERLVFFCTHRFIPLFLQEDLQFHHMFIQSLPFDPFGSPLIQAREKMYGNGFSEYYLPKALQNYGVLFDKLTYSEEQKAVHLLDRRVREKAYGDEFISFFPGSVRIIQ